MTVNYQRLGQRLLTVAKDKNVIYLCQKKVYYVIKAIFMLILFLKSSRVSQAASCSDL